MNTRMIAFATGLLSFLLFMVSCATTSDWGTTNPPIARLKVVNFAESTDIGIATEIDFSITNLTDQDLTNLTLTVTQNPAYNLELPFTEMTIDRIPAHGGWSPNPPFSVRSEPFMYRGRTPGPTVIYFTLTQNGKFLAKDYALVNVSSGGDNDFDFGGHH